MRVCLFVVCSSAYVYKGSRQRVIFTICLCLSSLLSEHEWKLGMLFAHFSVSVCPELILLILLLVTRSCLKEVSCTVCLCLSSPVCA